MELIKAIFKKFAEEPTYSHTLSIVDSMQDNMVTNLPRSSFYTAFAVVKSILPQLETMQDHTMQGWTEARYEKMLNQTKHYFIPSKGEKTKVKKRIQAVINGD